MTFDQSMSALGRGLALLIAEPQPIAPGALDAALAARHSVTALLAEVAGDGGLGRRVSADKLSELVRNPTGTANRLRVGMPALPVANAHELLSSSGTSRAEDLWLTVHRSAVVARHEWQTADRATLPRGPEAWSVTADCAAITAGLLHLEPAVEDALRQAGRVTDAEAVAEFRWSGLDRAVHEVWRLAHTGELPDPGPLRKPGTPNPAIVRSQPSQREGTRRLLVQLEQTHLSPHAMRALLHTHTRTVLAAATILEPSPLATLLNDHARQLNRAANRLDASASVHPSDSRAVVQAQQLHRFVATEAETTRRTDVAMTVARHAAAVAVAATDRAVVDISTGRWLIADGVEHDRPLWVRADMGDHCPDAVDHLRQSHPSAHAIAESVGPAPEGVHTREVRLTPPRDSLGHAVAPAPVAPRPFVPADRPAPTTPGVTERQL